MHRFMHYCSYVVKNWKVTNIIFLKPPATISVKMNRRKRNLESVSDVLDTKSLAEGAEIINSSSSHDVYLECNSGNSSKFYQMSVSHCNVDIKYGKIGTGGVQSSKSFSTEEEALAFVRKTAAEKVKKGYSESSLKVAIVKEVKEETKGGYVEGNDSGIEDDGLVEGKEEANDMASVNNDFLDREHNDSNVPDSPAVASIPKPDTTSNNSLPRVYLECSENGSDKFYCMSLEGGTDWVLTLAYGRRGSSGTNSVKHFKTKEEAVAFMNKTKNEKIRKGYQEKSFEKSNLADSINEVRVVKDDPASQLADLESGLKVFVQVIWYAR